MNQQPKQKSPSRWLILIPIQLVLDIIIFYICAYVDTTLPRKLHPDAIGHPAPALTLFAVLILPIITIIVIIVSIIASSVASKSAKEKANATRYSITGNEYLKKVSGPLDMSKDLFLCPIHYEADPCDDTGNPLPLTYDDREIHFTANATALFNAGSRIYMSDVIPSALAPAATANNGIIHFRTIKSPDGAFYIPLFTSYHSMVEIFGYRIHVGVVTYDDARNFCLNESDLAGIVFGPGQANKIMPRQTL